MDTTALDQFFTAVTREFPGDPSHARALLITHLLADRPAFVRAVDRVAGLAAVLPKPKSADPATVAALAGEYRIDPLTRAGFADPDMALAHLEARAPGQPVVLLDVGGYFAPALGPVCDRFSGRILGVVEDTENGWRRYRQAGKPPCPVFSVARSPLKEPEDYLVGCSVVFSVEVIIRSRGGVLPGSAAVLGYGKIGASIARSLHGRGVQTTVYDLDPVRAAEALAHGHAIAPTLHAALGGSSLVVCATGNRALRHGDFAYLRDGAYVASVTSAEDELEISALEHGFQRSAADAHTTRYAAAGRCFYLLADGNAVNFLHGGSVGPAIALVQAEILAAAAQCVTRDLPPGYHDVAPLDRRRIAALWLAHFRGAR